MLSHTVYFETLASINDETSPAWKSTLAGLVVLRLVDSWLDCGPQVVTTDVTGLRAVRESIAAMPESDASRTILTNVVNALVSAELVDITNIAPQLLAYSKALVYDDQWALSADVGYTLSDRARLVGDDETLLAALAQTAFANRRLEKAEEAETCYRDILEVAERVGNRGRLFRAQIGLALLEVTRGNLPAAEKRFDEIASHTYEEGLFDIYADAMHERAIVAYLRQQYSQAVIYGHRGLSYAPDSTTRQRILGDLATFFAELGHTAAARNSLLIVANTTCEQSVRYQSEINLMMLAVRERQEAIFHSYYRSLANIELIPTVQTHYHLHAAEGFHVFGYLEEAKHELNQALTVATTYKLNQLIFEIEALEKQLRSTPTVAPIGSWPVEVDNIAQELEALQEMTASAGRS